jgi:hypothetical protein
MSVASRPPTGTIRTNHPMTRTEPEGLAHDAMGWGSGSAPLSFPGPDRSGAKPGLTAAGTPRGSAPTRRQNSATDAGRPFEPVGGWPRRCHPHPGRGGEPRRARRGPRRGSGLNPSGAASVPKGGRVTHGAGAGPRSHRCAAPMIGWVRPQIRNGLSVFRHASRVALPPVECQ